MRSILSLRNPTMLVVLLVYGGWLFLTIHHASIPTLALFLLGGTVIALHGSLQHEAVHRLACRRVWLNELIGTIPLSLWLPFALYRSSHLQHHDNRHLTDPRRDPESYYVDPLAWDHMPRWKQAVLTWHNTLTGRMLLGPFLIIGQFLTANVTLAFRDAKLARIWGWHIATSIPILMWLHYNGLGLDTYFLTFVLPGTSLTLLRSFAEHKAREHHDERTAIVEDRGFFAFLFLNNNLHAAHHQRPSMAWYELPAYYRAQKKNLLAQNGGLFYSGYGEILRRFWRKPVDQVPHPLEVDSARH